MSKEREHLAGGWQERRYTYKESGDTYTIRQTIQGSTPKTSEVVHSIHTGQPIRSVDINGAVTETEYDNVGRVIRTIYADRTSQEITYSDDLTTVSQTYLGLTTTRQGHFKK